MMLTTPSGTGIGSTGVGIAVEGGVSGGAYVPVSMATVRAGTGVTDGVYVIVGVKVMVGVAVGGRVPVGVLDGVGVMVGVSEGVGVMVAVGVGVSVTAAV
jgi:hypothetical protein